MVHVDWVSNLAIGSSSLLSQLLTSSCSCQEALVAYTEALQLAESDELRVPIWANRALAALRLGRFLEALDDSDQALALKPEHVKALFRPADQRVEGLRPNQ